MGCERPIPDLRQSEESRKESTESLVLEQRHIWIEGYNHAIEIKRHFPDCPYDAKTREEDSFRSGFYEGLAYLQLKGTRIL